VMLCLGATQALLLALYGGEFLALGLAACAVGVALGFAAQGVISGALADLMRANLPPPGAVPALQGFLVGLVLLLGFALPPLVQLKNVPAVRVIRRESGNAKTGTVAVYAVGLAALAGLLMWQAGNVRLGALVLGGFGVATLVFVAVSWTVLRLVSSSTAARVLGARSVALRYGLANLRRHARGNAIQVASLALGLTAVLSLGVPRNNPAETWSTPGGAPPRRMRRTASSSASSATS
jgi:putative ABC transport system permease protein